MLDAAQEEPDGFGEEPQEGVGEDAPHVVGQDVSDPPHDDLVVVLLQILRQPAVEEELDCRDLLVGEHLPSNHLEVDDELGLGHEG